MWMKEEWKRLVGWVGCWRGPSYTLAAMPMITTPAPINHIGIDERGVARIVGHRCRVIDIVLDVRARGWTPEQIAVEYPHLSLGQIHAALSYYNDHKVELDADIESPLSRSSTDALRGGRAGIGEAPPSRG